jgi:hypothetical protein
MISSYAKKVFEKLEIRPGDHMHNDYAARTIDKYKGSVPSVEEVLGRASLEDRRNNNGWIFNSIEEFGPKNVMEALDMGIPVDYVLRACECSVDKIKAAKLKGGPEKTQKLEFYGTVQGVCFRGTAADYVEALGINCGVLENRKDGSYRE